MSAVSTWTGTVVGQRRQSLQKFNRGTYEYTETWEGKYSDGSWPNYAIGGTVSPTVAGVSPGNLLWYDIQADTNVRGPIASYVARASNKFDDLKSEWSRGSVINSLSTNISNGSSTLGSVIWFGLPTVTKLSYHINPPTAGFVGQLEVPVPPFTLPTPAPGLTLDFYHWRKTNDNVDQQNQIYVRRQIWSFIFSPY